MSDILHRVGIKSSPDETYKALATREGLAAGGQQTQGGKQVGGVLRSARRRRLRMKVLELHPKALLWQGRWARRRRHEVQLGAQADGEYTIVLFAPDGKEPVSSCTLQPQGPCSDEPEIAGGNGKSPDTTDVKIATGNRTKRQGAAAHASVTPRAHELLNEA